jgi:hypothetical protein
MAGTIIGKTKKGQPKKGQKTHSQGTQKKKGRELVPLMVGSYLTHCPSNVACMQIVRFNSNRRPRTSIICQCNFRFYSRG